MKVMTVMVMVEKILMAMVEKVMMAMVEARQGVAVTVTKYPLNTFRWGWWTTRVLVLMLVLDI